MKRAVIMLSAAVMFGQVSATGVAQTVRDLPHPVQERYQAHLDLVIEIVAYPRSDFAMGHKPRLRTRTEFAVAIHNMLLLFIGQIEASQSTVPTDRRFDNQLLRDKIAEDFWHIEYLMREFQPSLAEFASWVEVTDQYFWDMLDRVKKWCTDRGIVLRDPYNERFADVPEGHWADEAIHNLRRNGIVYGYPDWTFRP